MDDKRLEVKKKYCGKIRESSKEWMAKKKKKRIDKKQEIVSAPRRSPQDNWATEITNYVCTSLLIHQPCKCKPHTSDGENKLILAGGWGRQKDHLQVNEDELTELKSRLLLKHRHAQAWMMNGTIHILKSSIFVL